MLDYERAGVVHVRRDPVNGTVLRTAASLQDVSDLCADIGYRPSDLIQSNSIIWVEGPSDRIYLRTWLEIVAPGEFIEGIHYSVMFYGGALLRYLTADDPSVEEFISLRRLNRHSSILVDSDKASARQGIGETKTRVCREFDREDMPGIAWVTECRTIENYVPLDLLAAAVDEVHKRSVYDPPQNKWDNPLRLTSSSGDPVRPDKVKIARSACSHWSSTSLERGLRRRVEAVAAFIRTANGTTT